MAQEIPERNRRRPASDAVSGHRVGGVHGRPSRSLDSSHNEPRLMRFASPSAELYTPDGCAPEIALGRTTHLAVAAHHDDLEILAAHGILQCYRQPEHWFCGVVVGDGAGSPRSGPYETCSDAEMRSLRRQEQRAAAAVGEYGCQILLDHPSSTIKDPLRGEVVSDLVQVLEITRPRYLYTHSLTDKHDTHVAVALRVIAAARRLGPDARPRAFYGAEVWRDLDWLCGDDKVELDLSQREGLQAALLGVFDSQIAGGKRYDLAVLGRRRAHATFNSSHSTDDATMLGFAMDLGPLLEDPQLDPRAHAAAAIQRFAADVTERIRRFTTPTADE